MKTHLHVQMLRVSIVTLVLILSVAFGAKAANFYSVANGLWSATSTWATTHGGSTHPSNPPTSSDVVYIDNNYTVTVDQNNEVCGTLNIGGSASGYGTGTLVFNANTVLTVSGSVTLGYSGTRTGTLTMTAGGTLQFTGTLTATTGYYTFTPGTGTIDYHGAAQTVVDMSSDYYNLTLSGSGTMTLPATMTNISNNLTLSGTVTTTTTVGLTIGGAVSIGSGTTFSAASYTHNVAGNWTNSGTFNSNTSRIIFNGTTQSIGGTASTTFNNLTIGSGTTTLGIATTVNGTLTVNSSSTLANGGFALGSPTSVQLYCGGSGSTISGAGTLTLGGGVTVTQSGTGSNGSTISCPVALGGTQTFNVAYNGTSATAADLTVSGIISGSGNGITKTGAGLLYLSASNSYTGAVTISGGTLTANTLPNATINSSLGTGAGTANITIAGSGTLQYNGAGSSTSRAIILSGSGATIDASGSGAMTLSGGITGTATNLVLTGTGVGTESGVIGTTTGTVTKNGTGTWTLSGASTYTGLTTISAGTLIAGASVAVSTAGPFGNAASAIVLGDANTTTNNLSPSLLTGGAFTIARQITIANQATTGIYSLGGNTDNNSTFSGVITFNQSFSVTQVANTGTNTLIISGGITGGLIGTKMITFDDAGAVLVSTTAISNGTGTTAITKQNSGTLTLNFANTFTGGTTLNSGTLNINNASALGTIAGTFTITAGTINTPSGAISTSNYPLAINGNFTFTGSNTLNLGTGNVSLSNNPQITVSASTLTIGGIISGGSNNLTKLGSGTLSFSSNAVTMSGLTISAGTLISTSGALTWPAISAIAEHLHIIVERLTLMARLTKQLMALLFLIISQ